MSAANHAGKLRRLRQVFAVVDATGLAASSHTANTESSRRRLHRMKIGGRRHARTA